MSYRSSEKIYWRAGYYWNLYDKFNTIFQVDDPDTGQFATYANGTKNYSEGLYFATEYHFCPPDPYCEESGVSCCCMQEAYVGVLAVRDISGFSGLTHIANTIQANPDLGRSEQWGRGITGGGCQRGWGYEVQAGYGCTFSGGYYVGIEGFYSNVWKEVFLRSFSEIPPNVGSSAAGRTVTGASHGGIDDRYGASILPGFKPNECLMFYLKLGLTKARLHQKNSSVGSPPLIARDQFLNNFSRSRDLWGYLYGFGADIGVTKCLFVRSEFITTTYGRVTFERKACCSGAGFFVRRNYSIDCGSKEFKLGLVYKFPVCRR
jgi:opacity protein-like surface antigen